MREILEILEKRDGLTRQEAIAEYRRVKELILDTLAKGSIMEVEEILLQEIGLELDYIYNFI